MVFFRKTLPAPPALLLEKAKENGNYRHADILEAIKNDFKNKCYICEWKNPTSINVEHFIPHKGDKDLKFSWDNLFWSCYHCNITKSATYINILNCTIDSDNVDTKIKYTINIFPFGDVELKAVEDSAKVHETVRFLHAVYNGSTPLKKIESENMRDAIRDEIISFRATLCNYYKTEISDSKDFYLREIREHLSKNSGFTAFKRWIVLDNPKMKEDFEKFFD